MKNVLVKNKLKQLGQGMTEYIIIVALIAIAGIAAYSYFGQTMQGAVADVSTELSGQQSKQTVKAGAAAAQAEATTVEGMGTYSDNQQGQK
mgnify:CR=1 FL=1